MRCRGAIGLLLAAGGCSAVFGLHEPVQQDSGPRDDAPISQSVCVGVGNYQLCLPAGIQDTLAYSNDTVVITDQQCPIADASNPSWCIYAARHVEVTGILRATGSRYFVLIGTEDLTISNTGVVDVSSHVATSPGSGLGAGAGIPAACGIASAGDNSSKGGSGGAGGTYSTAGGRGGAGEMTGPASAAVNPQDVLGTTLRAGCSGTAGGSGGSASNPPGAGGGAVYLASKGVLTINGKVNASGAGGGRGNVKNGGGSGGGSGGMIALWSVDLVVTGDVFASGGGGGGGAEDVVGSPGGDATSAEASAPGGVAGGSSSCGSGPGCGGAGAVKVGAGQNGYDNTASIGAGGGGGGGLGVIRIISGQTTNGSFSPLPIRN